MKLANCEHCTLRGKAIVPPEINTTNLLFIGEAPGEEETEQLHPFVGRAGRFFMELLTSLKLNRGDASYNNACLCRPTRTPNGRVINRQPTEFEIECCQPRLYNDVMKLNPLVIVTLGKPAFTAFFGDTKRLRDVVGIVRYWKRTPIVPTYHPSAVMRDRSGERGYKKAVLSHIKHALYLMNKGRQIKLL